MRQNLVETILGAVVLLLAIGFLGWAYTRSNVGSPTGYTLNAAFDRIDGLDVGSDVRISGIKVGSVLSQRLDKKTYRADVSFSVENGIELPRDSSAAIVSASLLGGKYLALTPGGEDEALKDGQSITITQSSINLEDLIGQYIFGSGQRGQSNQAQ
ncbi:phospholipid/cholesterol/gamma-HCH transport system substrate-binding protein [Arboricoccus pini]|uniref:Phospholipid/cholesterol/gamma-HCH transport system substrate-binding protein n=1 Tax=Arboricoccus pini TaxID=1963835 RepID=A0A212QNH7_9PROT|nr:outer membrane lipid asymmetry maintenance protein MlaD [Arboricoccus pini]SNB60945.1 phospholipid/cholesterol/gamma-HCH transport system substrate-binding protein [Arboricoccus pini]